MCTCTHGVAIERIEKKVCIWDTSPSGRPSRQPPTCTQSNFDIIPFTMSFGKISNNECFSSAL